MAVTCFASFDILTVRILAPGPTSSTLSADFRLALSTMLGEKFNVLMAKVLREYLLTPVLQEDSSEHAGRSVLCRKLG